MVTVSSASYNSGYANGRANHYKGCRIGKIYMYQYGPMSGSKTFDSNGYIYVAGVLMNSKQVYEHNTATCTVTLNGNEIAKCTATTQEDPSDTPGYGSFSTNFIRYSANSNIAASVTGSSGRCKSTVFIVFIPD